MSQRILCILFGILALSGCNSSNKCKELSAGDALSMVLRELETSDYKINGENIVWLETDSRHSASTLRKRSYNVVFVVHHVGKFASVGNDLPLYIVDVETERHLHSMHIFGDCGINWTRSAARPFD